MAGFGKVTERWEWEGSWLVWYIGFVLVGFVFILFCFLGTKSVALGTMEKEKMHVHFNFPVDFCFLC